MRVASLFSGVGGFDLGFDSAGFTTVGQCEIDQYARSVLSRHWPGVPVHDDIGTLRGDAFGPAEVVAWGSPCQDLSVAGLRRGLVGERSNLFIEGMRFIEEMQEASGGRYPRFSVWENVPGALTSNGGRDFQAVLSAFMATEVPMPRSGKWANAGVVRGERRSVAWRVLDSQYFGLAQRRKRVFVVTDLDGQCASEILFEREGMSRHIDSRWEARPDVAADPRSGAQGGGRLLAETGVVQALTQGLGSGGPDAQHAQAGWLVPVGFNWQNWTNDGLAIREDGVGPLDTSQTKAVAFQPRWATRGEGGPPDDEKVGALTATGTGGPMSVDSAPHIAMSFEAERDASFGVVTKGNGEAFLTSERHMSLTIGGGQAGQGYPAVAHPVHNLTPGETERRRVYDAAGLAPTLSAEEGRGHGTPTVAHPIQGGREITKEQNGLGLGGENDPAYTLDTLGAQAVAFAENSRAELRLENGDGQVAGSLSTGGGKPGQGHAAVAFALRGRDDGAMPEVSGEATSALRSTPGGSTRDYVATHYVVRRLSPVECERLQGFPDGHTAFGVDGEAITDTQRYRMMGNAVSVPVARWIAEGVRAVLG